MKKFSLGLVLLAILGVAPAYAANTLSLPNKPAAFMTPTPLPYVWTIFPPIPQPKLASQQTPTNPDGRLKPGPMRVMLVRSSSPGCGSRCAEWIAAEGVIGKDTPGLFRAAFKAMGTRKLPIFISSTGGIIESSFAIGHMIRELGLDVVVSRTIEISCDPADRFCRNGKPTAIIGTPYSQNVFCESACTNILAAGIRRIVPPRAWVGVHEATTTYRFREPKGWDNLTTGGRSVLRFPLLHIDSWEAPSPESEYKTLAAYYRQMGLKGDVVSLMHMASSFGVHWLNGRELDESGLATAHLSSESLVAAIDPPVAAAAAPAPMQAPQPNWTTPGTGTLASPVTSSVPNSVTMPPVQVGASPSQPGTAMPTPQAPLSVHVVHTEQTHIPASSLPALKPATDSQVVPFATPAPGVLTTSVPPPAANPTPQEALATPPAKLAVVIPAAPPVARPAKPKAAAAGPAETPPHDRAVKKPATACSAAIRTVPAAGRRLTGEVRVVMSPAAGTMVLQRVEETTHVQASPKYFGYERLGIWVYSDGIPEPGTAVAPHGMNVQPGDTVTIVSRHQDSALPCHFVPNLVVAVKHK